jgi:tripartite-type tricarboxylate transporter receptor subunit TctC
MNFKSLLSELVYVAVIMITTNAASALNYPDHPIHVIIPYALAAVPISPFEF